MKNSFITTLLCTYISFDIYRSQGGDFQTNTQ